METIRNYLDNMFAGLPKSAEVLRLKEDLLSNMEDKYNELKAQGKSENEAIGIVISEFGNIDEIIKEMGLNTSYQNDSYTKTITLEEAEEYLRVKRNSGIGIGFGVALCILGVAMLILVSGVISGTTSGATSPVFEAMGLGVLFIFIAVAVAIFIFTGVKMEKYKYIANTELEHSAKSIIQKKKESFDTPFVLAIIIGVVLCILSPMVLIVFSYLGNFNDTMSEFGVIALLVMIAIAVFNFVCAGTIKDSFSALLKIDDYARKDPDDKVISIVSSIVWPITVCAFLIWGFFFDGWGISWILFPIVGILFGSFSGVYKSVKGKN